MDLQTLSTALPPPRASFLGLPLELRNEIYRNLLTTHCTRRSSLNQPNGAGFATFNFLASRELERGGLPEFLIDTI